MALFARTSLSEGDGTRTRNHRIDRQAVAIHKDLQDNTLSADQQAPYPLLTGDGSLSSVAALRLPADLAGVVAAWDSLPEHTRQSVLDLVAAARASR